jgi:hypothetical protein
MVHLFFTNSYFGRAHKQGDNLGFYLSAFGQDWLQDAGNQNYNKDALREFAVSPFAHNTIVIDETAIDTLRPPCKPGHCAMTYPHGHGVAGWHRMYPGFRHTRRITYNNDKAFLLEDRVQPEANGLFGGMKSDKKEHTFDMLFQVPPEIDIHAQKAGFILRKPGVPWELVLTVRSGLRPVRVEQIRGQTRPYLLGWYFPAYNQARPLTTIRFRFKGEALPKVVTSMYFRKTGSADVNPLWKPERKIL